MRVTATDDAWLKVSDFIHKRTAATRCDTPWVRSSQEKRIVEVLTTNSQPKNERK